MSISGVHTRIFPLFPSLCAAGNLSSEGVFSFIALWNFVENATLVCWWSFIFGGKHWGSLGSKKGVSLVGWSIGRFC